MKRVKPSAKTAESVPNQPLRVNAMAFAVATALSSPAALYAQNLPTGLQTVSGTVNVTNPTATSMGLNQSSQNARMNADTFSIGSGYRVDIKQPGSSSVMLMNVTGNYKSDIFGTLTATGKFFLVNPHGVLFGPGATVDVGGIVASTLPISYADATSGKYVFTSNGSSGSVEVQKGATITALNGYVGLFAPKVLNEGIIVARMGQVALAAGNQVTLDMVGDGLIKVAVSESALNASVMNKGTIEADGGNVLLTARSANALLDTVINTDGIIRANTIANRNGTIVLDGGDRGIVSVAGTIEAKGVDAGTTGGTVKVLGQYVGVGLPGTTASIDASGDAGGGTVLVGGNFHGAGSEQNATVTYIGADANIAADAYTTGNGGNVAIWANSTTRFLGSISARGGSQGGDGGFIETSGKNSLILGTGNVDASAPRGRAGSWLLDPADIEVKTVGGVGITTIGDNNTTVTFAESAAGLVIDPLSFNAPNANIILQADNDITITDAINLTNATRSFTAQAGHSVIVNNSITTNNGAITLSAFDPGTTQVANGNVTFGASGALTSTGGAITITNNDSGVATMALGTTVIDAGAGAISLSSKNMSQTGAGALKTSGLLTVTADGSYNLVGTGNTVSSFNGSNLNGGVSSLVNTAPTLTITGMTSPTTSGLSVSNTGNITLSGDVTTLGNVNLTATGLLALGSNNVTGPAFSGVILSGAGVTQTGGTVDSGAATLSINGNSNPVTLAGTLTTSNATVGAVSITGATSLQVGNINMTGAAGAKTTLTFSAAGSQAPLTSIQGANGALDINGGTMTLSRPNTYGGATTIVTGAVNVQNPTGLGLTTGGTTVNSGAALQLQGGITVAGEALTLDGTGVAADGALRNISGINTWTGVVTLASPTRINTDADRLIIGGPGIGVGGITGAGQNLTVGGALAGTTQVDGVISTTTGTLIKDGAGTLTLNAANTYTGNTTINGGVLNLDNAGTAGTSAGTIAVGTFELALNSGAVVSNAVTINGGTISSDVGPGGTLTGGITLLGTSTFRVGGGSLTVSTNPITGGASGINKTGTGTLTLSSGTNSYGGNTTVNVGTLRLGANDVIPDGPGFGNVAIASGATLNLNGFSDGINGLSGLGTVEGGSGTPALQIGNNNQTSIFGGVLQNTAGTLSITKIGTGTLTLSGNNVYTGTTTIGGGTLQVGAGGTAGTLGTAGAVTDNAALVFNRTDSVTVANIIGGTGTLTQAGSGTTTLSGVNTYAGSTTISGGTLSVSSDANLGTAPGAATPGHLTFNGGTLEATVGFPINANRGIDLQAGGGTFRTTGVTTLAYEGIIAGGGALTKVGSPGMLFLGGANIYGGTTTISEGTLRIDNSGGTGTTTGSLGIGAVVNDAALVFNRTNSYTVGNDISGTGTVTQMGAGGTLILTGTNTYGTTTISAGTLQVGNGGATGTLGTGGVTDNAALVFNRNNALTVTNAISGTGTLTQSGTGTLTLSGINSYAGLTTVSSGSTLEAASNNALGLSGIGNPTTVLSGGTLQINGSGLSIAEPITISGTGNGGNGALRNLANTNTVSGTVTLSGNATITNTSGTFNLGNVVGASDITYDVVAGTLDESGVISGGLGTNVIKNGAGTLRLSGGSANTYDGTTTINAGTLQAAKNGALGTGTGIVGNGTAVVSGATLDIDNAAIGNERVEIAGVGVSSLGALTGTGTSSLAGPLVLTANATVGGAGDLTLTGGTSGAFALSVVGGGNNTFSTNPVSVASIDVNKSGGTATFSNVTTSGNFTTQNANFAVSLTGSTYNIGGSGTFLNDGGVTIGGGGASSLFAGGLNLTDAAGTNTIGGSVRTTDQPIQLGAVSLNALTVIDSNATATNTADITIGAITGNTFNISFETGVGVANADVNGTSVSNVGTLSLVNIGGTATFVGNVTAASLSVPASVVNVAFTGTGNSITSFFVPANTGTLTLGLGGGTQTYNGGIDLISVGGLKTLNGTIATSGDVITTGNITLGSDTVLNTTAGGNPPGNTLTVGNVLGGGNDLTLNAGTGGTLSTGTLTAIDALVLAASSLNFGGGSFGSLDINVANALTVSGNTTTTGTLALTGGNVTVNNQLQAGDNINVFATNSPTGDVTIAANIIETGAAGRTLDMRANNSIFFTTGADVSTTNALTVILNSNRDGVGAGAISLGAGTVIDSNGGAISLVGGITASGPAVGTAANPEGIRLDGAQLLSGAGAITLLGQGRSAAVANAKGVQLDASSLVQSSSGTITITGTGGGTGAGGTSAYGVGMDISTVRTTTTGNIAITGTNTNGAATDGQGVKIIGGAVQTDGAGTISITGTSAESAASAVFINGTSIGSGTASGDILLRATGGLNPDIIFGGTPIQTTGNVTLNAGAGVNQASGSILAGGLRLLGGGTFTLNSLTNNVTTLAGTPASGSVVSYTDANGFAIGSITSNDGTGSTTSNGLNVGTGSVTLTSTGTVTQTQPITAATLTLQGAGGTFNLGTQNNDVTSLAATSGAAIVNFRDDNGFDVTGLNPTTSATLSSTGTVTQSGAISTPILTLTTNSAGTGTFNFGGTANDVTTLGTGTQVGTVAFQDNTGFDIAAGGLSAATAVTLSSTNTVTQSGVITTPALTLTTTSAGTGIFNLGAQNNAVTTLDADNAQIASLSFKDDTGYTVAGVNSAGAVTLESAGGVVGQGAGGIAATTLTLQGAGGTFNLGTNNNTVTTLDANNSALTALTFRNDSGFDVAGINATTSATLSSTGTVTQSGVITTPTLTLTTNSAGTGTFNFGAMANDVTTIGTGTQVGTVAFQDNTGFDIAAGGLSAATAVTLSSTNTVTQSGVITTPALTLTTTSAGTGIFNLGAQNNAVTTLDADNAQIASLSFKDDTGYTVAGVNSAGAVTLESAGGVVGQGAGGIAATTLTLQGAGGTFNLGTNNNTVTTLDANNSALTALTFRNDSGFDVAGINATTSATLSSTGTVTQSGVITTPALTLTTTSAGTGIFNLGAQNNAVTTLDADNAQIASLSFKDDTGYTVAGVNSAGAVTLESAGGVVGQGAGGIAATTLTLQGAGGTFNLGTNNNTVTTLDANNSALTALTFRNDSGFDVAGINATTSATLSSTGTVTQSGAISTPILTLTTNSAGTGTFNFGGTANDVTTLGTGTQVGTVAFQDNTGFDIAAGGLSAATAVTLSSTNTVTQSGVITTPTLTLQGAGGTFTLNTANNAVTTLDADNSALTALSFQDNTGFTVAGINTTGNTSLSSTGAVAQSGAIAAAGLELVGGGAYTLNTTPNTVTTIAGSTGDLLFANTGGLAVGTVTTVGLTVGGNLTLTTGGAVTQSAPLVVIGTSSINANGGAAAITLNGAGNNFGGTATMTGTIVQLADTGGMTVVLNDGGASTLQAAGPLVTSGTTTGLLTTTTTAGGTTSFGTTNAGSMNVTSTGGVSQSGPITTGAATISAAGQTVALANGTNNFTGVVDITAGTTSITDGAGGLTLGTLNTGDLTVNSSGGGLNLGQGTVGGALIANSNNQAITQAAALTVTGTSNITAGTAPITLIAATNNFVGPVTLSNSGAANAVQITDGNIIAFAPLTLGGAFTVNSGGLITLTGVANTGVQQYNNDTSLTGTFNTNGNNFNSTLTTTIAAGSTTVTVGAGVATFTGPVEGPGALAVNSSAANGESFLSTIGAVTPLASITTDLPGSVFLGGNVTTVGAQTFNDAVVAAGRTFTSTGGGAITATNAANDFTGTTTISTSGTVSLRDANDLTLASPGAISFGTTTVGGNFALTTTNGAVTQSGPLNIAGTTNIATGSGLINLGNGGNDFGGGVTATSTAGGVTFSDANTFIPTSINSGTGAISLSANSIAAGTVTGSSTLALASNAAVVGLVINIPAGTPILVTGGSGPWSLNAGNAALGNPVFWSVNPPSNAQELVVKFNGVDVGFISGAASSAASAASATAAAAASGSASDLFGTDSVEQQIEYGFAGDVGTLPPIDHRLQGVGISVPVCFNESREGEGCAGQQR